MQPSDNQQEDKTVDQFSLLHGLMADLLSFRKLDPLLQRIADLVISVTEANSALILLVNETEEYLGVVASAGTSSHRNMGERRYHGAGFAGIAWSTGNEQYLANSEEIEATKGYWPSVSQLFALPLKSDDTVVGVAVLAAPAHQENFRVSIGLAKHLASLAGIAIVNARSREQAELEVSRMRALREINVLLADFKSPKLLIHAVTEVLMHAIDISRAVYVSQDCNGSRGHADVWSRTEGEITTSSMGPNTMLTEGVVAWCFSNNEPVYIPRNSEHPQQSLSERKLAKAHSTGSMLYVPITSKDGVVGVMSISRDISRRDLNENERNLLLSIASQVSRALLNWELSNALKHRAFHDSLTELPNRYYFEKRLDEDLDYASVIIPGAVLFIDLDGFKAVNDSLGHHYGDQLLIRVADQFKSCLRDEDTLARIGGDEFAIITRNIDSETQAIAIASRLITSVSSGMNIINAQIKISASIGVSFFPNDGFEPGVLIRNADEAMYQAKASGKGTVVCFDQRMADESQRRVRLEYELRDAIKTNEFELYFQPKVDTCVGCVNSVEALIRWRHPQRGLISPGEFIPVAEDIGMIDEIGSWVLEHAIMTLASWRDGALAKVGMAVNIAASQFLLDDFTDVIFQLIHSYDINPSLLELEVTESIVMNDVDLVVSKLNTLRAAGIAIAVDDFGTGYSSLSYLQNLPLDVLKIDRSFVSCLDTEKLDQSMAKTIVLLAEGLGLSTVAEGVETEVQFRKIQQLGCKYIQGYFFAKPCAEEEVVQAIQSINDKFMGLQDSRYTSTG